MKLASNALLGLILLSTMIFAGTSSASDDVSEMAALEHIEETKTHKVFRSVDEKLQKAGLAVQFCRYVSKSQPNLTMFRGVGPCLEGNFREAMKTKGLTGFVQVWVLARDGSLLPLVIRWRPTEEGYLSLIRELLALKMESIASWLSKKSEVQSPLSFRQNFLGRIEVEIPESADLAEYFTNEQEIPEIFNGVHQLSFVLKPKFKKAGKIYYDGELILNREQIQFHTNLNLLKKSRLFQTQGDFEFPGMEHSEKQEIKP